MRSSRRYLVLTACAALLLPGACATGDEDDEAIREAREQGAREARRDERLKELEEKLKERERGDRDNAPGPGPTPPSPPSSGTGGANCGGAIPLTRETSCEFAGKVKETYENTNGASVITVYSPVTRKTYTMHCSGTPTTCSGGNNARVRIP